MSEQKKAAVITGDVVASASIKPARRKKLLAAMGSAMEKTQHLLTDYIPEIFQGDSFQGYTVHHRTDSLRASILIILYMLEEGFETRVSTGIGTISFESGRSLTSDGTAFHYSGRNMDVLKKTNLLLAFGTDEELLQSEWEVHTATLNFLLKRCSVLQAAALIQMLHKKTQQEAAATLLVKQPAIQQRLQAAGWQVIQTIIDRFERQF